MKTELGGLKRTGRKLLGKLLRTAQESFTVAEAAQILDTNSPHAAVLLAMWTRHGWLHRIRRGLYISVPLQSLQTRITPE